MCLYFLEQLGSGHSRRVGGGKGLVGCEGGAFFFDTGSSSFGLLVFLLPGGPSLLGVANGVGLAEPGPRPRPPFGGFVLLLRNLLCTELLVSVKLLRSFIEEWVAFLPRFPLPLGVRASMSLVGESHMILKQKSKLHSTNCHCHL